MTTKVTTRKTKNYWFRLITASEVIRCLTVRDVEGHTGPLPKATTTALRDLSIGDSIHLFGGRFSVVKMPYTAE